MNKRCPDVLLGQIWVLFDNLCIAIAGVAKTLDGRCFDPRASNNWRVARDEPMPLNFANLVRRALTQILCLSSDIGYYLMKRNANYILVAHDFAQLSASFLVENNLLVQDVKGRRCPKAHPSDG